MFVFYEHNLKYVHNIQKLIGPMTRIGDKSVILLNIDPLMDTKCG